MVNALVETVGSKANLSKSDLMDIVSAIIEENATFNKDSIESKIAKDLFNL